MRSSFSGSSLTFQIWRLGSFTTLIEKGAFMPSGVYAHRGWSWDGDAAGDSGVSFLRVTVVEKERVHCLNPEALHCLDTARDIRNACLGTVDAIFAAVAEKWSLVDEVVLRRELHDIFCGSFLPKPIQHMTT